MSGGRRPAALRYGALLGLLTLSCGPAPVAVVTGLEIVVAEGDGQFGTVGQLLTTPLRAVVRVEATQQPKEDVDVHWEVLDGGAALESAATAATDETGSVEARVRLGGAPMDVSVRATIQSQPTASVTFTLHTVEIPELTEVAPTAAAAGDTVTLTGSNFSPVTGQNVVLVSGVRARVLTATATQLTVEVPTCLPSRTVSVTVQLGTVASGARALTVTGGTVLTTMPVGDVLDATGADGFDCFALAGGPGAEYLAVVYAASTVGAAMHPYRLTALSSSVAPMSAPAATVAARLARAPSDDPQAELDERLRGLEGQMVTAARSGPRLVGAARAPSAPAAVPEVGDTRTFHVWAGSTYEDVTAQARYVGAEAAIYIDLDAPSGGFNVLDIQEFAARFDDVIYPEDTSTFGTPSDLDRNERVIILFTPVVNSLTERGASGFVGGFFFGNDLLPDNDNSNAGEIFYALVPDPTGRFSDPRPTELVLSVVPAVLAHEFQHMIHFNQRYLALDGGQEALWLSEALAQMAEEIVARAYDDLGDDASAEIFRSGARIRARRYLADTGSASLIVTTGQGSLTERGAGFLHLLYLTDQEGSELLGRLTRTTRTGVANVEAEIGRAWPDILADWWAATDLDGSGVESGRLAYPTVDLPSYLGAPFPLVPVSLGPASATEDGTLWSSSAVFYLLAPDASGSLTVRLGGEAGGPSSAQSQLRLRIVRIS